jgi:hypothetical protein
VLVDLPARAEAGDRPPVAHVVERSDHVGDHRGMPVGAAHHQGAQPDPAGERAQRGEQRRALQHPAVADRVVVGVLHEVVAQVDGVRPQLVGGLGQLPHLGPGTPVVDDQADVHAGILSGWGER